MYKSSITRGSHLGTSGVKPLMSLKSTVMSENTKTSQHTAAPKKVSRESALLRIKRQLADHKEANR